MMDDAVAALGEDFCIATPVPTIGRRFKRAVVQRRGVRAI
jgi:hypothetical protein